ncbi:DUF3305 domain-containing protein [Vibrio sp. 99-70-13A1]|uniref:DUF3305 domain-containing protein n=1 Tax=Vibrio sp. 99-70-13A1 TaxID=2607601 RepID=UPI00149359E4|nr:DUF3305 domain-containing protein [Vibrio sp. 99-70-13A1]NOH96331.1 DUF3305 domain-containing protein [Vibrio sp. 99-70-13A1]
MNGAETELITEQHLEKNESSWPLACELTEHEVKTGVWATTQLKLDGFNLTPNAESPNQMILDLHRDERTDYRFNLSSQNPKLFLVIDSLDDDIDLNLVTITASQSVAGQYMDGDYLVLSAEMPLPIQAWMEAYIGRHGELLEVRRKKRKGAGRSSGQ